MIFNETILVVDPEHELSISASKKKEKNDLPPFFLAGREMKIRNQTKGYDYTKVLLTLSKPEQWFFGLIVDAIDYKTNQAFIFSKSLSKAEQVKASNAFKSLHAKGLIKKVKKELYIVNPDARMYPKTYKEVRKKWDNLP